MNHTRGFSLIELLVVLLIMGILAATAVPLARQDARRAKEAELRAGLRALRGAIDDYKHKWDTGHIERKPDDTGYPPNLEVLVDGVVDAADPKGRRLLFLRRLPRDPFASPQLPAARTWALRSYDSAASEPEAGADVYDAMPTAPGTGLDGIPYKQW